MPEISKEIVVRAREIHECYQKGDTHTMDFYLDLADTAADLAALILRAADPCPQCNGRGGCTGTTTVHDVPVEMDADCDYCDGTGIAPAKETT